MPSPDQAWKAARQALPKLPKATPAPLALAAIAVAAAASAGYLITRLLRESAKS